MAKKDIENYCFIGRPISSGLNCFFVDRTSEKDKKLIFDLLLQRQKSFCDKNFLALVMFPEGTCSCGRNILRFKKGAFYSLLPIKR